MATGALRGIPPEPARYGLRVLRLPGTSHAINQLLHHQSSRWRENDFAAFDVCEIELAQFLDRFPVGLVILQVPLILPRDVRLQNVGNVCL